MQTFIVVFAVMLLFVLLMAVGVLFGRKPIKGSCGGVGAALGETDYTCPVCGDDPAKCDEQSQSLGYEIK